MREQGRSPPSRAAVVTLRGQGFLGLQLWRKEGDRRSILTTGETVSFSHLERRLDVFWGNICGQEYPTPAHRPSS